MRFPYLIVDVFSERPFGGNQLAVVTDARGLTGEGMQAITREFNFAESSFVLPPVDPASTRRVRIFTPGQELPFAGHPTIGTAAALVLAGASEPGTIVLEEGVGPVAVEVERREALLWGTMRLERRAEIVAAKVAAEEAAGMLALEAGEVQRLFCAGVGVPFTFVQLASREAVDRARLDLSAWRRLLADSWGPQLYVFAGELADGAELHARMFGPAFGIAEDPATGSAAAALVDAAAQLTGTAVSLTVAQGVAMGRPSMLTAAARRQGEASEIAVGGGVAFVAEGAIEVPEAWLSD